MEVYILIEVKNLTKQYGDLTALDNVSFKIRNRKVYGLLGPDGAGKSTVMNIIAGCLEPTEGSVTVNGYDVCEQPMDAKRQIGYLPQRPPLFPDMTLREYLTFVAGVKGVDKELLSRQVKEAMSLTELAPSANRLVRKLSKNEQRRAGMAQALLGNPDTVILDEPLEGLDPAQLTQTRELIRRLSQTKTVVLSGRISGDLRPVCDYIITFSRGKVVSEKEITAAEVSEAGVAAIPLEETYDEEEN